MAKYKDYLFNPDLPNPGQPAANLGYQVTNLLTALTYSVEVFRTAEDAPLVLRVWYSQHCDSNTHKPVGPKVGP